MTQSLFDQQLLNAFQSHVGAHGITEECFNYWLDRLVPAVPRLLTQPQREAEPVFSLPSKEDDLAEIEEIAAHIKKHFRTLIVAGMGGSSLSGEALGYLKKRGDVEVLFIDNIDPVTLDRVTRDLQWRDTGFFIVSKSGNTVETLAQMSILLRLAKQHKADIAKQFFVMTITNDNMTHALAQSYGMRVIAHDPKLGGRFSILSAVGLIPAAVMGLNIRALRAGAQSVLAEHMAGDVRNASAVQAAAVQRAIAEKNKPMNVLIHYCDALGGVANWYRQCWGESLGKCDLATTPVLSRGATDQHSQLQLYLDGPKDKFFTLMQLQVAGTGEAIDFEGSSDVRLQFLKGRTVGDLMEAEQRATLETLVKRGCPIRSFTMQRLDEEVMGALLMHFALEVIFSAELLGVDAFDQPAVEDGKVLAMRYLSAA